MRKRIKKISETLKDKYRLVIRGSEKERVREREKERQWKVARKRE